MTPTAQERRAFTNRERVQRVFQDNAHTIMDVEYLMYTTSLSGSFTCKYESNHFLSGDARCDLEWYYKNLGYKTTVYRENDFENPYFSIELDWSS